MQARTRKNNEATVCPVHHNQRGLIPKRILGPLLKCITSKRAEYILVEIHEGVCGNHSRTRTMTTKVLRADYY